MLQMKGVYVICVIFEQVSMFLKVLSIRLYER